MEPATEHALRRGSFTTLADLEAEAFLLTALPNVRYLCGFTGSNAALLVTPAETVLFTDPRYTIQAGLETDCRVQITKNHLLPAVVAYLAEKETPPGSASSATARPFPPSISS